jgi:hypothetical protein
VLYTASGIIGIPANLINSINSSFVKSDANFSKHVLIFSCNNGPSIISFRSCGFFIPTFSEENGDDS